MSDTTYLCYDLKGIQSFIFAVPRLKYICGGSVIIDEFDRNLVPELSVAGAKWIFSGGGKGAFACESDAVADEVQSALVKLATDKGLGICFGRDRDYSEAAQLADQTYPWLPSDDQMEGYPCPASGLYPVANKDKPHPKIQARDWSRGSRVSRRFEEFLLKEFTLKGVDGPATLEFMHNVSMHDEEDPEGQFGCEALGSRNRWAIIAMDGNDMGLQHKEGSKKFTDTASFTQWLSKMSGALDECSRTACKDAAKEVLGEWADSEAGRKHIQECMRKNDGRVILPFRPLIVGGDDIVVICHVSYAMKFVQAASAKFNKLSKEKAEQNSDLWPATGDELTISAGVLFAPVTMPLATAIPYTEALMASAKKKGRDANGKLSPACVDWEAITEGLLDTPAARRQREFRFKDESNSEIIELTRRPYTLARFNDEDGLKELIELSERYKEVPGTIRYQVLPGLRQSYWDRQVFIARLGKKKSLQNLVNDLLEEKEKKDSTPNRWKRKPGDTEQTRTTDVVDALLLLEEAARMTKETAGDQ
jgi:hypothetical protein